MKTLFLLKPKLGIYILTSNKLFENFKKVVQSEYTSYLEQKKFSLNNGKWSDFTNEDLLWIEKEI
jgi:hypothetical protein